MRLYKSKIDASSLSSQQPLLEADLGLPILSLASGRLLSSSDSTHLLILHPRKVCVYSLSGTGNSLDIPPVSMFVQIASHDQAQQGFLNTDAVITSF